MESNHAGDVQQVAVCESAINALSYAVLHSAEQKTLYLSTDGSGSVPLGQLQQIPQVILAFDRDEAGEAMAQRIGQELPNGDRHSPTAKDWNEDLQNHLSQVQQQFKQINRLPERSQGHSR
ncbi:MULTISPECIES: toprim domain-containing protein [Leptolyngbya]|uniref:toprim domain-containing protein n=1 Tax=Leptolyngbya TaxID=47251 RepID=UPI0016892653|nr:toprim domain-containing protein [Leptolyngbya sp. FACHB-1624]